MIQKRSIEPLPRSTPFEGGYLATLERLLCFVLIDGDQGISGLAKADTIGAATSWMTTRSVSTSMTIPHPTFRARAVDAIDSL